MSPFANGLLALVLLAACAPATSSLERPHRTFLWLQAIDGFETIDDRNLVLRSGRRQALVEVFGFCGGLRDSETIAIDAPLGYLDETGFGRILHGRGPHDLQRCAIDRVVEVQSLDEAKDLVARERLRTGSARGTAPSPTP